MCVHFTGGGGAKREMCTVDRRVYYTLSAELKCHCQPIKPPALLLSLFPFLFFKQPSISSPFVPLSVITGVPTGDTAYFPKERVDHIRALLFWTQLALSAVSSFWLSFAGLATNGN